MTLITVEYEAGTQKSPQQTEITKPCFTSTNHVHFPDGRLSTLPPYATSATTGSTITGVIRAIHSQKLTGTQVGLYTLFGSHSGLFVQKNGVVYNITPLADQTLFLLGTDPLAFASGSSTMTITHTAHGLATGDIIVISGATEPDCVASGYINTSHVITVTGVNSYTVTLGTTASHTHAAAGGSYVQVLAMTPTITLGTNKIATSYPTNKKTITVTHTSHGLTNGQRIKIVGVTANIGGVPFAQINGEHEITYLTANTFSFQVTSNATSSSSSGTGAKIVIQMASGNENQGSASGYGAGIYQAAGTTYGSGGYSTTSQNFPRIWSFAPFGNSVLMCAGDYISGDGQKIYLWDGDTATAPTALSGAPTDCNWVSVVNNQVVALCGDHIKIGVTSDTGTVAWSGYGYNDFPVQRVWKMISMTVLGDKVAVIHTPNEHLLLRYVGGADVWDLADLFLEDGIIAPKASTVMNSAIYWMGNRGFYGFDGSTVVKIKNEQNEDWILQNINNGQSYKCFAMPDTKNQQVYWYFPTGTDNECEDYVIYNPKGHFTLGEMSRTAAQQQMVDNQFLMANSADLYRHFTNGAVTFSWLAKSSYSYLDGSDLKRYVLNRFVPDANMSGTATLTTYGLEYPQATETNYGTYSITGSTEHNTIRSAGKLTAWMLSGTSQFTMGGCKINVGSQ